MVPALQAREHERFHLAAAVDRNELVTKDMIARTQAGGFTATCSISERDTRSALSRLQPDARRHEPRRKLEVRLDADPYRRLLKNGSRASRVSGAPVPLPVPE